VVLETVDVSVIVPVMLVVVPVVVEPVWVVLVLVVPVVVLPVCVVVDMDVIVDVVVLVVFINALQVGQGLHTCHVHFTSHVSVGASVMQTS